MMKFSRLLALSFFIVLIVLTQPSVSLAQDETTYIHTTSRAVAQGREQDFLANMRDIIKPLYQAEIDAGRLQGWYLWRARYKSENAPYEYIISRVSTNLADHEQAFEGGLEAAASRVFRNRSWSDISEQLRGDSRVVKTELWQVSNLSLLREGNPGKWANIVWHRNHSRTDAARSLLMREFMNPWQQGRVDHGISAGWGHYVRRVPIDDAGSYDVAEIEYYDDFNQILGAGIAPMVWDDVKTDNSDFRDNMRRLNETRDFVKREVWELVDYAVAD